MSKLLEFWNLDLIFFISAGFYKISVYSLDQIGM